MKGLVCSICGMRINENNIKLNERGYLDNNTIDNIKVCPFCGVSSEYLIHNNNILNTNFNILDEKTRTILDHSLKLEIFNGDFYKEAAILAEKEEIKELFQSLSRIEYMHASIHKRLGKFDELPNLIKLDYTKYENDKELLLIAKKREMHAVEYYKKYKRQVCSENIKIIFEALSNVEKEHIFLTDNT